MCRRAARHRCDTPRRNGAWTAAAPDRAAPSPRRGRDRRRILRRPRCGFREPPCPGSAGPSSSVAWSQPIVVRPATGPSCHAVSASNRPGPPAAILRPFSRKRCNRGFRGRGVPRATAVGPDYSGKVGPLRPASVRRGSALPARHRVALGIGGKELHSPVGKVADGQAGRELSGGLKIGPWRPG